MRSTVMSNLSTYLDDFHVSEYMLLPSSFRDRVVTTICKRNHLTPGESADCVRLVNSAANATVNTANEAAAATSIAMGLNYSHPAYRARRATPDSPTVFILNTMGPLP